MTRFSIVTPVYRPPAGILREAIDSVRAQTLGDWELCLVDDASGDPAVERVLADAVDADPRIRVERRRDNNGIVEASNDGLAMANGEFVGFLDHDDLLEPQALELVAQAIDRGGRELVDYVYTDEDKIDGDGHFYDAFHKPGWSPSRFRCQMYTSHFGVLRRSVIDDVGRFRRGFDGSQDFDLVLRASERARRIEHVPAITYHWRALATSTAKDHNAKPEAYVAGERAITEHIRRTSFPAEVHHDHEHPGVYQLTPVLPREPLVSIVIPTCGSQRLVHGLQTDLVCSTVAAVMQRSTYRNFEIIVVVDPPTPGTTIAALRELAGDRLRLVPFERPFHFASKINVGALHARGEYLLLLNDDVDVIAADWIEHLLMYALDAEVGAVGGKLRFADGRLQHVGVLFHGGDPAHAFHGYPGSFVGPFCSTLLPADLLCVTGACLLVEKAAFDAVGGLSPMFPVNFNDVDFCLKLRHLGRRNVFSPGCELYHYESSSRPAVVEGREIDRLKIRWGAVMKADPYYNPNYEQSNANHMLSRR